MLEYGLLAGEVLNALHTVLRRDWNDPLAICALAEADARMVHAGNEYIQLNALVYELAGVLGPGSG